MLLLLLIIIIIIIIIINLFIYKYDDIDNNVHNIVMICIFFSVFRLWGAVNVLYCYRCGQHFSCSELGHCNYHPMNADFSNVDCSSTKIVGVYPCCQKKVLHFDPCSETSVSLKCGSRKKLM